MATPCSSVALSWFPPMKFPKRSVWARFDRGSASPIASLEPNAVICICIESLKQIYISPPTWKSSWKRWFGISSLICSIFRSLPLFPQLLMEVASHFSRPGEERRKGDGRIKGGSCTIWKRVYTIHEQSLSVANRKGSDPLRGVPLMRWHQKCRGAIVYWKHVYWKRAIDWCLPQLLAFPAVSAELDGSVKVCWMASRMRCDMILLNVRILVHRTYCRLIYQEECRTAARTDLCWQATHKVGVDASSCKLCQTCGEAVFSIDFPKCLWHDSKRWWCHVFWVYRVDSQSSKLCTVHWN